MSFYNYPFQYSFAVPSGFTIPTAPVYSNNYTFSFSSSGFTYPNSLGAPCSQQCGPQGSYVDSNGVCRCKNGNAACQC